MARLIKEESVPLPVENRLRDGLTVRYLEVNKFELWLRWAFMWLFGREKFTWKKTKELARDGALASKQYAGACLHPLWTNIYQLK